MAALLPKRTPQRPYDVALAKRPRGCPLCAGLLPPGSPFYTVGAQLYYKAHRVSWGPVRLRLFLLLLERMGMPISTEALELDLWGRTGVGANLLKANATHLRNSMRALNMPYKLEATPGKGRPRQAATREPPGYRLVALPRRPGGL